MNFLVRFAVNLKKAVCLLWLIFATVIFVCDGGVQFTRAASAIAGRKLPCALLVQGVDWKLTWMSPKPLENDELAKSKPYTWGETPKGAGHSNPPFCKPQPLAKEDPKPKLKPNPASAFETC